MSGFIRDLGTRFRSCIFLRYDPRDWGWVRLVMGNVCMRAWNVVRGVCATMHSSFVCVMMFEGATPGCLCLSAPGRRKKGEGYVGIIARTLLRIIDPQSFPCLLYRGGFRTTMSRPRPLSYTYLIDYAHSHLTPVRQGKRPANRSRDTPFPVLLRP